MRYSARLCAQKSEQAPEGAPDNLHQPPPMAALVVGAINTPNHPPFNGSKFSAFTPHTRAIEFNTRHKQEIKSSPKSKDNSNQIVTSEREILVFI
jgi:hypothetical protein